MTNILEGSIQHFDARAGVRCVSDSTVSVATSVHQKLAESMNHILASEAKKPQGTAQGRQGAATRSAEVDILKNNI